MVFVPIFIFGLGLLMGSFLNVAILRMNTGKSMVTGRSKCTSCSRELEWYELLPVFSFMALRGKCRTCKGRISFQYPIVELVTAIVFTVLFIRLPLAGDFSAASWLSMAFAAAIACTLIVILVYDVRHKIIPDMAAYLFILLSLGSVFYKMLTVPGFSLFSALAAGVLVALPFFLIWLFSKGALMGFGDVKLALGIGWLLGVSQGFAALLLSFWIGGVAGLFLIALTRRYSMKSQIPFAPFLIAGVAIAGIWGVSLANLIPIFP